MNIDELGPMAAKSYPGSSWSDEAHRPHFKPDYARHGYTWFYGALAHREGKVFIENAEARNTATWLHFLDGLEAFVPRDEVYLIVDALPLHWTLDTMLWNWGHPRFHFVAVPTAAAWLNLIEGFWKILTQRSLPGRDFHDTAQIGTAMHASADEWNKHPTPFLWGREPKIKRVLRRTYVYRI
ncbi:MAG: transposase [Chloroflexi bacterium]|nr:transposase [Chloroflexota bacterium]